MDAHDAVPIGPLWFRSDACGKAWNRRNQETIDEIAMAIIVKGSRCSICRRPILKEQDIIGTPHFIADEEHPLWVYSDSAMHRACFLKWDHRDAFRDLFNATADELYENPAIKRRMMQDGSIENV